MGTHRLQRVPAKVKSKALDFMVFMRRIVFGANRDRHFVISMRRQWINWMLAGGIVHGTTSPPSRADVANWVDAAMVEMKEEGRIIQNAWRRHGYEWFVGDEEVGDKVVGGNEEGEEGAV